MTTRALTCLLIPQRFFFNRPYARVRRSIRKASVESIYCVIIARIHEISGLRQKKCYIYQDHVFSETWIKCSLGHRVLNGGVYILNCSLLKDFPMSEKFSFELDIEYALIGTGDDLTCLQGLASEFNVTGVFICLVM